MSRPSPWRRARENLPGIVSVLVTGIWLAALVTGQDWWLGFMLFGYVVLVPIVALLFGDEADVEEWWDEDADAVEGDESGIESGDGTEHEDEALAVLPERYARGELIDEQFERKLDRLLDVETLEDLEDRESEPRREVE